MTQLVVFLAIILALLLLLKNYRLTPSITVVERFLQGATLRKKRGSGSVLHPLGIDNCYLINLERRTDRLAQFKKDFQASDLAPLRLEVVPAVEGSKLDLDTQDLTPLARREMVDLEVRKHRTRHYQLTKGALGCYLSHLEVWKRCLQTGDDRFLIFEDDARLPRSLGGSIQRFASMVPEDWDMVLLGYVCLDCQEMREFKTVNRFFCTHCYLITRKGIHKFLDSGKLFPIATQIDWAMGRCAREGVVKIYAVKVPLVRQSGNSDTDIQVPLRNSQKGDVWKDPEY